MTMKQARTSASLEPRRPRVSAPPGLTGLQVFVVEDEALLAMVLRDMLGELGCIVAGVAGTVSQSIAELASIPPFDAALLDVHLHGEMVFPVADLLLERNVPFAFSTGYSASDLGRRYRDVFVLDKPYNMDTLAAALATLCTSGRHALSSR